MKIIITRRMEDGLHISLHLVPEKELELFDQKEQDIQCLKANKELLVNALKARIQECENNLADNVKHAFAPNEYQIFWQRNDGELDYFNIPSYECMKNTVQLLENEQFVDVARDRFALDQIVKALLNTKIDGRGSYSWNKLTSALVCLLQAEILLQAAIEE